MIRSAASKVMWVGRATVFMVGLAVILALMFGAASMAFARDGDPWLLGRSNVATAITTLGGQLGVNGPMVRLINNNTGTNDTALDLRVQAGEAPMRVNSGKVVTSLNADSLDDKNSTAFLGSNVKSRFAVVQVSDNSNNSANVECADGEHAIGGGAALTSFVSDVAIISSRPAVAGTGFEQPADGEPFDAWRATAVNPSGGTGTVNLRAFVVCATQG